MVAKYRIPAKRARAEREFWSKVQKTDTCWLWTGVIGAHGYGVFGGKKTRGRAHRLMWERVNGPIPDGLNVCHRCDNPPCVNPAHLFLGTVKDNAQDMMRKGRGACGWTDTKCDAGHALTYDNVIIRTNKSGRQYRHCRTCDEARSKGRPVSAETRSKNYARMLKRQADGLCWWCPAMRDGESSQFCRACSARRREYLRQRGQKKAR